MTKRRGENLEWIESHSEIESDDCLIWPFSRNNKGYPDGTCVPRKAYIKPNMLMCALKNGPKPTARHEVAHSCGNGHLGCINPNHLRWATHAENMQEMVSHGRSRLGKSGRYWATTNINTSTA